MSVQELELSEQIVVDRSPELARCKTQPGFGGDYKTIPMKDRHITEGQRGDGATCAFAMMLKESVPGVTEVHLAGETPYIVRNGEKINIWIGSVVIDWIGRFDRGEPVEPLPLYVAGF